MSMYRKDAQLKFITSLPNDENIFSTLLNNIHIPFSPHLKSNIQQLVMSCPIPITL